MDATRIGEVAAGIMEALEGDLATGRIPEDARVVDAVIIVELAFGDPDDDGTRVSLVTGRVSGNSLTVALGLLDRGRRTFTDPDGAIGE